MSKGASLAMLFFLASLLVLGIASASTAAGAETRVWAFDLAEQIRVGGSPSLTLELRRGCEPAYDDLASDSLLAARGGLNGRKLWCYRLSESAGFWRWPRFLERAEVPLEERPGAAGLAQRRGRRWRGLEDVAKQVCDGLRAGRFGRRWGWKQHGG